MEKKLSLSETKSVMVDILVDLKRVCDENNLKMFLAYGTLLGAVRHKGFIPWDDDIDVFMPRLDYEKLIRIYNSKRGQAYYQLCCLENNQNYLPFVKIVDLRVRTNYSTGLFPDSGNAWVDVFPLDGCSKTKIGKRLQVFLANMFTSQIAMANSDWEGKQKGFDKINKIAVCLFRKFGVDRIVRMSMKNAKKHSFENSKTVNNLTWDCKTTEEMDREDYQYQIPIEFEGHSFYAMRNYKNWLEKAYGSDYMQLPPEDKRVSHHIDAWLDEDWVAKVNNY